MLRPFAADRAMPFLARIDKEQKAPAPRVPLLGLTINHHLFVPQKQSVAGN